MEYSKIIKGLQKPPLQDLASFPNRSVALWIKVLKALHQEAMDRFFGSRVKPLSNFILFMLLGFLQVGCVGFLGSSRSDFDERSISILTLDLFNQRIKPEQSSKNWKGDWLYRRERLESIDMALLSLRPDLAILQQVLGRRGSPSESDKSILSFGSLDGYQWNLSFFDYFEDTQEEQFFALAMGAPLKSGKKQSHTGKLGVDGAFALTEILVEDTPLWVLNVEMPASTDEVDIWYRVLGKKLKALQTQLMFCNERLIVAGYLPARVSWRYYQNFLSDFKLKDTSSGFCEVDQNCLTANPKNDIYFATSGGKSGSQVDRILSHSETIVYTSKVVLDKDSPLTQRASTYGLKSHWPTRRFGWNSILRLPRCRESR